MDKALLPIKCRTKLARILSHFTEIRLKLSSELQQSKSVPFAAQPVVRPFFLQTQQHLQAEKPILHIGNCHVD